MFYIHFRSSVRISGPDGMMYNYVPNPFSWFSQDLRTRWLDGARDDLGLDLMSRGRQNHEARISLQSTRKLL
jgi:hypothetical protein